MKKVDQRVVHPRKDLFMRRVDRVASFVQYLLEDELTRMARIRDFRI